MTGTYSVNFSKQEEKWVRRLQAIAPQVKDWLESPELLPNTQPGSAHKGDEIGWLQPGLSAAYQIQSSLEHLNACLDLVLGHHGFTPVAPLTLGRTAYVSAINATWLLSPNLRKERRTRAFHLKAKEIQEQLNALRDIPAIGGHAEKASTQRMNLEDKRNRLEEIADQFDPTLNVHRSQFIQTRIIETTINEQFGGETEKDEYIRTHIRSLWRMSSAAAHGYYHFALSRTERLEEVQDDIPDDSTLLVPKIDQDIGPLLIVSHLLLNRAIRLYKQRSVNFRA